VPDAEKGNGCQHGSPPRQALPGAYLSPVEQCLALMHHDPRARQLAASVKSPVTSPVAIP